MIQTMDNLKAPSQVNFALSSLSDTSSNPFNPSEKVSEQEEYWVGEHTVERMDEVQVRAMNQFIIKQRGPAGSFWYRDVRHKQLGTWNGSLVVDGINQDGIALSVRGGAFSQLIAPAGDRFQLGDYLYELIEDAVTNGSGRCELSFLPDLRVIPTDGQSLIVNDPLCKCRLLPKQNPPQGTTKGLLSSYKFKFREDLR